MNFLDKKLKYVFCTKKRLKEKPRSKKKKKKEAKANNEHDRSVIIQASILIIIILVYHWSLSQKLGNSIIILRMHSAILKKIQASLTSVARETISKNELDFIDHPFE